MKPTNLKGRSILTAKVRRQRIHHTLRECKEDALSGVLLSSRRMGREVY